MQISEYQSSNQWTILSIYNSPPRNSLCRELCYTVNRPAIKETAWERDIARITLVVTGRKQFGSRPTNTSLLDLYGGTNFFELGFDSLGLVFGDTFFDVIGSLVN